MPIRCVSDSPTGAETAEREAFIVEEMCQALRDMGGKFVLPFRFHNKRGTRITHHLFFVSKAFKGYALMKDIMHAHATGKQTGRSTSSTARPIAGSRRYTSCSVR